MRARQIGSQGVLGVVVCVVLVATACASRPHKGRQPSAASSTAATSTSAATGRTSSPSGFVAFGDFGGGSAQHDVARAMENWATGHPVAALVSTGDNVYTTGDPSLFAADLDEPYQALRGNRQFWVTLGNHDVADGHGAEQLRYLRLPDLPYTEELPGVQLLFLDANHPDAAQATWLDARLSEPGPALRVVVFHQPAYSCATHGSTDAVDAQWVPVLERHRVALVLNGHDHYYERFTSASGVTYVVTGGGGRELYRRRASCTGVPRSDATASVHHFVGVDITGSSMTVTAVDANGTVIDHTTISR